MDEVSKQILRFQVEFEVSIVSRFNFDLLWCMMQSNDSGLASYVAGQIDRTLSWKVLLSPYKSFQF